MIRYGAQLLVFVVLAGGCGRGPETVPCRGLVTFNGQRVEQANVYFLRTGGAGTAAIGITDAQGRFELKTGPYHGAMPGKYVVTVQKDNSSALNIPDPLPEGMSRLEYMKAHNLAPLQLLPEKYSRLQETPLHVDVSRDAGKNDLELKLEGTAPSPKPRSSRR
jgi:hypothetical protein